MPQKRWLWLLAALLGIVLLVQLGNWQVRRLTWKRDLIARVESRAHASPRPAPGVAQWPDITRANHEYLRVELHGRWLHQYETLVQATTTLGAGYWVLTPLQQDDGTLVWVNRGFVPPGQRSATTDANDSQTLVGLLRISEPKGAFLRENDPTTNRWHSRDIQALSAARSLPAAQVAPYFVDQQTPAHNPDSDPVAGLTVLHFANNHLIYALTWYGLALGLVAAIVFVCRDGRRHNE